MKEKRILNVFGQIDEKYIQEASPAEVPSVEASSVENLTVEAPPANEMRRPSRRIRWVSVAACLLLIVVSAGILSGRDGDQAAQQLKLGGGDVGTLHFFQVQYEPLSAAKSVPDFLLYVNHEMYRIHESDGGYAIEPVIPMDELPACRMEIAWKSDTTVQEESEAQRRILEGSMADVSPVEETDVVEGLSVHGNNGDSWDSEQVDVYVADDCNGGVLIFTLRYFTEAAEGHGARFTDMLRTFEVVSSMNAAPAWLSSLQDTVMEFIPAIFADDFSDVADILADDAVIEGYHADVYEEASVADIDYTVDNDENPASAVVSVRHRLGAEEPFRCLTIRLTYADGVWNVKEAGW